VILRKIFFILLGGLHENTQSRLTLFGWLWTYPLHEKGFNNSVFELHSRQRYRDSVFGITTRYGLNSLCSNLGKGKQFFLLHAHPERLCGPPTFLQNGYWGSSPGLSGLSVGIYCLTPSRVEIKNEWKYPLLSFYTFMAFYKAGIFKNLPLNNDVLSCSGAHTTELKLSYIC